MKLITLFYFFTFFLLAQSSHFELESFDSTKRVSFFSHEKKLISNLVKCHQKKCLAYKYLTQKLKKINSFKAPKKTYAENPYSKICSDFKGLERIYYKGANEYAVCFFEDNSYLLSNQLYKFQKGLDL